MSTLGRETLFIIHTIYHISYLATAWIVASFPHQLTTLISDPHVSLFDKLQSLQRIIGINPSVPCRSTPIEHLQPLVGEHKRASVDSRHRSALRLPYGLMRSGVLHLNIAEVPAESPSTGSSGTAEEVHSVVSQ